MKITFLISCILMLSTSVVAQVKRPNKTTGQFYDWYNTTQAHKDLNTIGFGPWKVNGQWEVPPLVEGQVRQDFALMRGRDNQLPWKRSLSFNFNLGLNLRMYQGKPYNSYPVLPINFIAPGFSVDYYLNHLPTLLFGYAMPDDVERRNIFNLRLRVSHFSNGQSGNFYNADSTNTNVFDGNFSTNFFMSELSWSRFNKNDDLFTTKLLYRTDFGIGDALGMESGLKNSYGRNRVGLSLQWRSSDRAVGHYTFRKAEYGPSKEDGEGSKYRVLASDKNKYTRYASWLLRLETDYILGNLDDFPTFKNQSSEKLRGSARFTIGYYPANMRNLALFTQVYYGRDYYNIRYTQELLNFKAGFILDMMPYEPRGRDYMTGREASDVQ